MLCFYYMITFISTELAQRLSERKIYWTFTSCPPHLFYTEPEWTAAFGISCFSTIFQSVFLFVLFPHFLHDHMCIE